ncbi:MAG: PQQ-binding-like beta-propeller repeat protein [Chthoniobacter sp.]|uniref:PQQ-binding-like beta-propeller repeat protein n=1 Tax=Chthoniobacter sp. TaxID=2510640 RepID=UPI0032A3CA4D
MNEAPRAQALQPDQEIAPAAVPGFPRLGFPIGLVLVYWTLFLVVDHLEKPYFYGFIYGMASALVFALCFLGWWGFNRSIRRAEKAWGFALIVAGAWVAAKFSDRSINVLTLSSGAFPLVVTVVVAWMFLVKRTLLSSHWLGFATAVVLGWAPFLLVRSDGFDSMLQSHLSWRWTPTAEQRFLAQMPAKDSPASTAAPVVAADSSSWAAFRGPDRDGVIRGTKVATDWKSVPPQQLWKHAVGPSWSSLIVVGDRLYTQEQRGAVEAVVCYDSATGRELWAHEDTTRFDEAVSGAGPRATPTFVDGRLYAFGGTGILNCLDAQTGKLHWSRDSKTDSQAKPPMWGMSSSPLVVDGNVIVYAGGEAGKSLLACRADTGDLVWTASAGQQSYSSPQITTIAGVRQCLMFHDFGLTSFDPTTGKKLWETGLVMKGAPRCGQPHLVGPNQLAVAVLDGPGVSLIDVAKDGDQWKISPVWASKDLKPEFPDFVVHDGNAYGFDSSIFCCLNLATGKRTWKDGRFGRGQVILLEDQALLLVVSESGEVILQAADAQARKELGRFQAVSGKTWNGPVIANGRLYLRNAEEMACYQLEPARQASLR